MRRNFSWTPFITLFEREVKRFMKVRVQTIFTPLVSASLYLFIFGVNLKIDLGTGQDYLSFLIPGLVMMGCLNHAFQNASSSIISSRFSGELEDYRVSTLTDSQIIWALSLGGLMRGLIVSTTIYFLGEFFHYYLTGGFLGIAHPFILLLFLFLGGISFAQIGLLVAFTAKTFDHVSAIGSFIIVPLIYLGGVFFSIASLPPFWQSISKMNPLLYMINGVRYGISGQSDTSVEVSIVVTIICVAIFYFFVLRCLKRSSFGRW